MLVLKAGLMSQEPDALLHALLSINRFSFCQYGFIHLFLLCYMYYIVYIIFIYIIHSLIICHGFIYSFIHLKNIY